MFGIFGIVGGIVLILAGVFLFFLMPGPESYQPSSFSIVFVVLGILCMIFGAILIFAP
jgi:hypothetical protein